MKYWVKYLLYIGTVTVIFLISTRNGMICELNDSRLYIKNAISFKTDGKLYDYNGDRLYYQPPLYPVILSFGSSNIDSFARILNLVSYIGSILIWIIIAKKLLGKKYLSEFYSWMIIFNAPILMISVMVMSEMIFLFLLSICLYSYFKYYRTQNIYFLILSAIFGGIMVLQRNAGMFILIGISLSFLFMDYSKLRIKLKSILLFISIAFTPGILWNLRLFDLSNHQLKETILVNVDVWNNFRIILKELSHSIIPVNHLPQIFSFLSLTLFLIAVIYIFQKRQLQKPVIIGMMIILTMYCCAFIYFIQESWDIVRFLAVIQPLYLLLLVFLLDWLFIKYKLRTTYVYIMLSFVVIYSFLRIVNNVLLFGSIDLST